VRILTSKTKDTRRLPVFAYEFAKVWLNSTDRMKIYWLGAYTKHSKELVESDEKIIDIMIQIIDDIVKSDLGDIDGGNVDG
jgi:hypothetical protein